MEKRDSFFISFDQNPAAAEAVKTKKVGDDFPGEIRGKIKSVQGDGIEVTVDAFIPEGFEEKEDEAQAAPMTMSGSEPTMSPIASMVAPK